MLISGSLAVGLLLACGVLAREDLTWWWHMRGCTRVVVEDLLIGNHVLTEPTAVAQATEATKRFIQSLPRKPRSDCEIIGYISAVQFQSTPNAGREVLTVWLDTLGDDEGVIRCMGTRYLCKDSSWFCYVGEILRPLAPELVEMWRRGDGDRDERIHCAKELAVIAPGTEGLAEFFCDLLTTSECDVAMVAFYAMGPRAAAATPCLERILSAPTTDDQMREYVSRVLGKIRGAPP